MQVVTEKLELPPLTLQNPDGKRLMTVDIGTTTIAMQLYDMTGKVVDSFPSVNPQVSYGADVLSRIEAAKDPGKAADMQKKVRDLMEKGVQSPAGPWKNGSGSPSSAGHPCPDL